MAIDKVIGSIEEAISDIHDGATIMFGGFGAGGVPRNLVIGIRDRKVKNLTLICNGAGGTPETYIDMGELVRAGQVKKIMGSFMAFMSPSKQSEVEKKAAEGTLEVELMPQGTLAERIRIGGAGIGGFYTPVGIGTEMEIGKEKKFIDGREMILELALHADFACIKAHKADRFGNLIYHGSARTFNPVMATAAKITIAEVDEIVETGELNPDFIHTPGIYVTRVVTSPDKN